ncbi:hypothetical protein H5410_020238 [Solanum commersonii]|uniref:Cytochrome P450 n=1 Tax=Solanum commersonii TaxID=4109 RepID=A0A9J5Z9J0_SOLCO|nr:hypothetical protein H5410_020238 [Solanum commersonii]
MERLDFTFTMKNPLRAHIKIMDSWFIILITLIFLFSFFFFFFTKSKTKKKLPPGPFTFPLIGN